jgi:RecA-family ATPase
MTNEKNYQKILQDRKFDRSKVPKQEQITFTIQGKIIAQLGSYAVFTGASKSGKSTFVAATIASAFNGFQDIFEIKLNFPKDRKRIGYFDTESSSYDFYMQMKKIEKFIDRNGLPDEIDAYNTREDNPKDIRSMIVQYLKSTPECSILIVDGFLDLLMDYNNVEESRFLTNWFKKITKEYNITLIGVLHTGKGNNETLGHLGSNTDRWANSTLIVEKDKNTKQHILKPKFLRSDSDFDPIAITNYDGRWMQQHYIEQEIILPKKTKK